MAQGATQIVRGRDMTLRTFKSIPSRAAIRILPFPIRKSEYRTADWRMERARFRRIYGIEKGAA